MENQNNTATPMNGAPANNGNEISFDNGTRTAGQFAITYQQSGRGGCIPVVNGVPKPELMFGYISESDKQACMNLIQQALVATNGNTYQAARYIQNAVMIAANDIKPDEAVTVEGVELLVNYTTKKIYEGTTEIANLDDVTCELPQEAVKVMLMDRAKHIIVERRNARPCCDTCGDYEDCDEAYDEGYEDGYDEGYDEGYEDGVTDVVDDLIN